MRHAASRWGVPAPASRIVAGLESVPAFGVLSSVEKDNIYWFAERGFVFTSPWVVTQSTMRSQAVLLLTTSGEPFHLEVDGRARRYEAAAIAPLTRRGLCAVDVGLITVHVGIHHPLFRAFRRIARPGVFRLDRRAFQRFDFDLVRAYQGRLILLQAKRLFEGLVETAVGQIPASRRRDARSRLVEAFVRENPLCTLRDLARALNVSYTTASELFSRVTGLPFRAYRLGLKCERVANRLMSDVSLTQLAHEAGFTDSAHLTRTWQRSYGHPPSYTRDAAHVRVFH